MITQVANTENFEGFATGSIANRTSILPGSTGSLVASWAKRSLPGSGSVLPRCHFLPLAGYTGWTGRISEKFPCAAMETVALAPIRFDDWFDLALRLATALLAGGAIGWNREIAEKPAGLRTYMLVSAGAALFVLVPLQLGGEEYEEGLSRVLQGVAAGIGFLGAGTILRQESPETPERKVEGLTSAAAIWCTAALGAAAGCGLWPTALLGTLFVVVVLSLVRRLERFVLRRTRRANGPRPRHSTPKYSSDSAAPESESR